MDRSTITDEKILNAIDFIKKQLIDTAAERIAASKLAPVVQDELIKYFASRFEIDEIAFMALVNRAERKMINQN